MKRWLIGVSFAVSFVVLASTVWAQSEQPVERRKPVAIEGKALPLRVLARPFSNIYQEPKDDAAIVQENVSAFQPFYVYTKPAASDFEEAGWYEVGGDNRGGVIGWMKGDDVMEWKQAMCLAYTHPEGRQPVLMFRDAQALQDVATASSEDRTGKAKAFYDAIDSQTIPADFPVLSVEPKQAVFQFINEQFYLLPILAYKEIELDGREGRMLKMAAATKKDRGATELTNKEYLEKAIEKTDSQSGSLKNLQLEVVYVIDMTASMQPFIDATCKVMKDVARILGEDPEAASRIKFGLWGFRDAEEIEGMEFNTRNFTPELLSADEFVKVLEGVTEAKVGSKGFDEDVFSGVDKAMRETDWNPQAMRYLVIIGDAPSHKAGHQWNASGQSESTLRQFANDNQFSISAIRIRNPEVREPKYESFDQLSEEQFKTLSLNPGMETAAFIDVDGANMADFEQASASLAQTLRATAQMAKAGNVEAIFKEEAIASVATSDLNTGEENAPAEEVKPAEETASVAEPKPAEETATSTAGDDAAVVAKAMVRAAMVEWLGKQEGVEAPRDITAWVADKDLMDPAVQSLEVRVLINKNQLDSLRTVLQEIMAAGRRGQIAGEDFFTALLSTSATLSVTPEQIRNARTLAQTGLVPEFLLDLPYKSRIMSMNDEVWSSWGQDQQDEFLNDIDAKIQLYAAIHDNPEGWVQLNQGDDPDEFVHPVNLEMLP